jgi:hypothetical protein
MRYQTMIVLSAPCQQITRHPKTQQKANPKMTIQPTLLSARTFTIPETAKLLGLLIRELEYLHCVGVGPHFEEDWPYICSSAEQIERWAIDNVHAPIPWFERFKNPDPDRVNRCRIEPHDHFFVLCEAEKARMLRLLADRCANDPHHRGICRIYRADSPGLRRTPAAPIDAQGLAKSAPLEGAVTMTPFRSTKP